MKARRRLDIVLSAIRSFDWLLASDVVNYDIREDVNAFHVTGRLAFIDGTILSFSQALLPNSTVRYRYQYLASDGTLIFRYDNSPHHPTVKTFPRHKHTPTGIVQSEEKLLNEILKEIADIVLKTET